MVSAQLAVSANDNEAALVNGVSPVVRNPPAGTVTVGPTFEGVRLSPDGKLCFGGFFGLPGGDLHPSALRDVVYKPFEIAR
jgi:hypothetical protein